MLSLCAVHGTLGTLVALRVPPPRFLPRFIYLGFSLFGEDGAIQANLELHLIPYSLGFLVLWILFYRLVISFQFW